MGKCILLRFIGLWPTNSINLLSFKVFKLKLAGEDRQRMTGFCSKEKKTHQKVKSWSFYLRSWSKYLLSLSEFCRTVMEKSLRPCFTSSWSRSIESSGVLRRYSTGCRDILILILLVYHLRESNRIPSQGFFCLLRSWNPIWQKISCFDFGRLLHRWLGLAAAAVSRCREMQ